MVRLVKFHELIYPPRLLDCQQKLPAPSLVKGAAIVALTGLHVEPVPDVVAVAVGTIGVLVRVNVGPAVGVRVRVAVGPEGVLVRVAVRVKVAVGPTGVLVTRLPPYTEACTEVLASPLAPLMMRVPQLLI